MLKCLQLTLLDKNVKLALMITDLVLTCGRYSAVQSKENDVKLHNYHNSGHYPSSCLYLKLNLTIQVCLYLTGNTLRLRYEPNRLMLPIGL
jgi:hypothetical protein